MCNHIITRRDFLKGAGAVAALSAVAFPKLTFASLPTDNRLVIVILRGALDGLAAIPAYGDKDYVAQRRTLAIAGPTQANGVIDLNGFFGLHPAMAPLHPYYQNGQLVVIHAAASPYRSRSHFDGQNLLENGTDHPGAQDGWLNRALFSLKADPGQGLAFNQQVPLMLQGPYQASSWAPKGGKLSNDSEYMKKVAALYQQDAQLSGAFGQAMDTQSMAAQSLPPDDLTAGKNAKGPDQLYNAGRTAASFLAKENGPRVAVLEASGWDTHFRQGASDGQLALRLGDLAKGLTAFPTGMGEAWKKTTVIVVTEFGRTVAENGTGGTDHGTGTMMLVLGGNVKGGQVLGKWPGLASGNLYQNRDLMPTTDARSIFKTALYTNFKASQDTLNNGVFPGSADAPLVGNLFT